MLKFSGVRRNEFSLVVIIYSSITREYRNAESFFEYHLFICFLAAMERSERPSTGRSAERPVSHWRRDQQHDEATPETRSAGERPLTSAGRPQTRIERPVSRRGLQSASRETSAQSAVQRSTTPARNALARPPSASAYSQRVMTANTRLNTMSSGSSLARINTGLPPSGQMNMTVIDRPITQQGIAGVRPGTTRGLPMTR